MADITKELNEIKSAIYGREVRGSIHDGIDKINKETEDATKTSKEAIEVTNQLLDGSFDEGVLNTNIEKRLNDLEKQYAPRLTDVEERLTEFGVSYKMFGAALDGVTDDTVAIQNAHNFANQHGFPVIQRNANFVLNDEVEVKTDVDLSGSTLITTWVDPKAYEYSRTSYLYRITDDPFLDITDQINQSDFIKGATVIASLTSFNSGSIVIRTTEIDLLRNDGGVIQQVLKSESNAIGEDSNGELVYPLTKDYSKSTGFRVLYKPFQEQLTFKQPKVILKGAQIYSVVYSERNNVDVQQGLIEEQDTLSNVSPLYTVAEFVDSHNIKISNVECPIIGRSQGTGQNGRGYLFLFTRSSKIRIDRVFQLSGWSGINGNWYRDILVTNSNVLSISGHANAYDMSVRDCTIYNDIQIHGGGILDVDNCDVEGRNSPVAITTRKDYASDFDGVIRVRNTRSINSLYLVQIHLVDYDCGRKVYLPDVEIDNCRMENPNSQATYLFTWRGFAGRYAATLPNVKINRYKVTTDVMHRTLYLPQKISNPLVEGKINIELNDAEIPVETFNPNPYASDLANIQLPHIENNKVKLDLKVKSSLANFSLFGTSNINIKCDDSDVYLIRTGTNSADSVTSNGDPINLEIVNSDIYRGFTDFPDRGGANRIILSVINSRYLKFYDSNGQTDNAIGPSFAELIKYAKNNKAEPTIILPGTNPGRLFNYTDDTYWKQSSDVGINRLTLSNVLDNAVLEYYRYEGVIALSIDFVKINRTMSSYGLLQIARLPVGYRPKTRVKLPLTTDNGTYTAVLDILPTGEVRISSRQNADIPSGTPFYTYGIFI